MDRRFLLLLLIVILGVGFYTILIQRLATGTAYPHYASFRSDPLGTSVLYEAIGLLEHRSISRNFLSLSNIQTLDGDTALLLLGYPRDSLNLLRSKEDSPVHRALMSGARLVITINPGLVPEEFQPRQDEEESDWLERRKRIQEQTEKGTDPEQKKAELEEKADREMERFLGSSFLAHYHLELVSPSAFKRPEEGWKTKAGPILSGVERKSLPRWFSQYRWKTDDTEWKVALTVEGQPVVLECQVGKGSIVIASDSYFLSNESLHLNKETDFLLWLIGNRKKVIFDETIHGTVQTTGIMKLIRKQRLHGILIGLLISIVLWAWRSASPLIPVAEDVEGETASRENIVLARDTSAGLINLLRRSIPERDLLAYCLTIWRQNRVGEVSRERLERIETIIRDQESSRRPRQIVSAYREIAQLLRNR